MIERRAFGFAVAGVLMVASSLLAEFWFSDGLRYLAFAYILIDLIHRARAGYRRRRPYWTAHSWRRYAVACAVPVVAIVMMLAMMVALENRSPMTGQARSALRTVWVMGTLGFMLIGAIGLVSVIEWLHRGEPSRQCVLPEWLPRRRREAR